MLAVELYDGPSFRVLRRYFAEPNGETACDLLVLSAKYGFVTMGERIRPYEMRMSKEWARARSATHLLQLRAFLRGKSYKDVFVNLGKDYLAGVPNLGRELPGNSKVTFARGRIGQRLRQMKKWLARLRREQQGR
jgi:hypothetical protein